jgi:hypothetical protein
LALNETARKATKSKNTNGSPIKLPSKILAAIPDPRDEDHIYVAEAAGNVKRINVEVGQTLSSQLCLHAHVDALGSWLTVSIDI